MNRTLQVKRLYSMGNFNNVEFYDQLAEVPENVILNENAVGLLYYLMILEQEKAHKRYLALYKKYPANPEQFDKAFEIIEKERVQAFTELMLEINKPHEPQNKE